MISSLNYYILALTLLLSVKGFSQKGDKHHLDINDIKLLITGAWVATDDTSHTLYMINGMMVEHFSSKKTKLPNTPSIPYSITSTTCDFTIPSKGGTGFYIDGGGKACGYIVKLNDDSLSLRFTGTGQQNFIKKRVKK
jgi:hypothetical protein